MLCIASHSLSRSLLPVAIFGLFAAGPGGCWSCWRASKPRASERLDEIEESALARREKRRTVGKKSDAMTSVLAKASPALAKPLAAEERTRKSSKLKTRLANAGFRGETAAQIFLGLKFLGLIVGLCHQRSDAAGRLASSPRSALIFTASVIAGCCFTCPTSCVDDQPASASRPSSWACPTRWT